MGKWCLNQSYVIIFMPWKWTKIKKDKNWSLTLKLSQMVITQLLRHRKVINKQTCLLSWRSLVLIKLHAFSMFFWAPLSRWKASYFRHLNNILAATWNEKRLIAKISIENIESGKKYESGLPYLGNNNKGNVCSCFSIVHAIWFCVPAFWARDELVLSGPVVVNVGQSLSD